MRTSVIVGAHSEGNRLWKTVESIIRSGIGKDVELVVVDDASKDGSAEMVRARFPHVTVLTQSQRSGVSATRTLGVRHARGGTLVFLDGHTKPELGAIERLTESVERSDGKAIITPRIVALDENTWQPLNRNVGSGYMADLLTFDSWWISEREMKEVSVGGAKFLESPVSVGCALAISREFYDELWGFDPHMQQWGNEDIDISLKAWMMGGRILHDTNSVVAHRFQSSFSNYDVGAEYPLANRIRTARKIFTPSVWEEWVERSAAQHQRHLKDHPEGLWARAWEVFQERRASVESERSHVLGNRVRDEFWYAKRFDKAWPLRGSAVLKAGTAKTSRILSALTDPTVLPQPTIAPHPTVIPKPTVLPEPTVGPDGPTVLPEPTVVPVPTEVPWPTRTPPPPGPPDPPDPPDPPTPPSPPTPPELFTIDPNYANQGDLVIVTLTGAFPPRCHVDPPTGISSAGDSGSSPSYTFQSTFGIALNAPTGPTAIRVIDPAGIESNAVTFTIN